MSEEPVLPASEAELVAAVREVAATGQALLGELAELSPEELLRRVLALQQGLRLIAAGALELEVASVTVPDSAAGILPG